MRKQTKSQHLYYSKGNRPLKGEQATQTPAAKITFLNAEEEIQQADERRQQLEQRSGLWRDYPRPHPGKLHPEAALSWTR